MIMETETFAKPPFCPISTSGSNFNPRNTQCIPVINPAKAGSPSLNLNKNKYFSKVSSKTR